MSDTDDVMDEEGPSEGERVTTTRWWVSRPHGIDAVCLYMARYVVDDGVTVEQQYLDPEGRWVDYIDFDVVLPALMLSGRMLFALGGAPASLRDNEHVAALLEAIRSTVHDDVPAEIHEERAWATR